MASCSEWYVFVFSVHVKTFLLMICSCFSSTHEISHLASGGEDTFPIKEEQHFHDSYEILLHFVENLMCKV